MKQRVYSEKNLLRQYRTALTNAEQNPSISQKLIVRGYNADYLEEGRKLIAEAEALLKESKSERIKKTDAHDVFDEKCAILDKVFREHRSYARVGFRLNGSIREKLAISGPYPVIYAKWIDAASNFYEMLAGRPDLLEKLGRFSITEKEVREALQMIDEVKSAYTFHTNLKGDSQNTTDLKVLAMEKINNWMRDFYEVSRIALRHEPQQLESLGIVVKS